MTIAVSALASLLLIAIGMLMDQWLRKKALLAYLAMRGVPFPSEQEWETCLMAAIRHTFRRRKK